MISRRHLLSTFVACCATPAFAKTGAKPEAKLPWPVLLAQDAPGNIDPSGYLVSEKLDGVRALWDGQVLRFRSGGLIAAPAAFTAALPDVPLDGELWLGRSRFEALVGTVRRALPDAAAWQGVRLMAFELPAAPGSFADRAQRLAALAQQHKSAAWTAVEQRSVATPQALQSQLQAVVAAGGEGLMLHKADSPYHGGRSEALLKLKPLHDAEALVLAHIPGRGKLEGCMGALRVRLADGVVFYVGTGFSDAQRSNPPAVGSTITFTYRGVTDAGVPRFASYLRQRLV
jgi:DNA ligase 1